jgi:hypothetical protein
LAEAVIKILYRDRCPNLVNPIPIFGGLIFRPMEIKTQSLKELYEKDFYLWLQENLRLLKNRELDLVDWENLVEEIEDMGKSLFKSVRSHMSTIMEHLYKWENFRYVPEMGYDWIETITNARRELRDIFEDNPSLKVKAQDRDTLQRAWELAVHALIDWFKLPRNKALVQFYFKGRIPTKKDFPQECPYTFEHIMEYEPWLKE